MKKNIFCLVWLLIAVILSASVELVDTSAGERANEIIELLNGESSYKLEDYINENFADRFKNAFPISAHTDFFQRTQTMYGKLQVFEITKSTDEEIRLILKAEDKDSWLELTVNVELTEPNKISALFFRPIPKPENKISSKENKISNFDDLHKYLSAKAENNKFSGVVLIAKDEEILFHKAYGFANKSLNIQNKKDTKFNIGSLNKIITSIAIAQLMEQNKLNVDDTIGKFLTGFPPAAADKITIRHLLQMRSGWGDYWDNEVFLSQWQSLKNLSDYIDFIKKMPLEFEPGERMIHSNTSFEVLGAIIEEASGMDYYDYVRENIYQPTKMINSDSFGKHEVIENRAIGYTNSFDSGTKNNFEKNNLLNPPLKGTPAGGGFSTAGDMLKFARALKNNKLLTPEYTNFLMNRFEGEKENPFSNNGTAKWAGASIGVNAFLGIDLENDFIYIVLSNYDPPAALDVGEKIIELMKNNKN